MEAEVQLSTFTAFVSAPTGAQQLAKVIEATAEYDPDHDFYRRMREAALRSLFNQDPSAAIRAAELAPDKKKEQYLACALGLQRWMKRTKYEILERPPSRMWMSDDLGVNVNPEMILRIADHVVVAKLYCRQDELTRDGKNVYSYLVKTAHQLDDRVEPVLLDLRNGRLQKGHPPRGIASITQAQAAAFLSMWRSHKVA